MEKLDAEKELTRILQEELDKIWEETPIGYNRTNNAYHIGKGIMIDKKSWKKYLIAKKTNDKLTPMDYVVNTIKEVHKKMEDGN